MKTQSKADYIISKRRMHCFVLTLCMKPNSAKRWLKISGKWLYWQVRPCLQELPVHAELVIP